MSATLMMAFGLLVADSGAASNRRRTVSPAVIDHSLVIVIGSAAVSPSPLQFVHLGSANVSSRNHGIVHGAVAEQTLALRVERRSGVRGGTATLRVWLRDPDSNVVVRVNGFLVSSLPRVVDPLLKLGEPLPVLVELEIKAAARQGIHLSAIEWEAVTND